MADELQTKRIIDLAQKTGPEAGDNLAVDNATSGTRRILWENLLDNSLSDDTKAAPAGVTGQAIEDAKTTFTDLNEGNVVVNYDEDELAGPDTPLQSIRFPLLPYRYTVPVIDNTLTQSGQAADAKVVGDEISDVKSDLLALNYIVSLESGAFTANRITKTANVKRIRTVSPIPVNLLYSLALPSGYDMYVFYLDNTLTSISASGVVTSFRRSQCPANTAYVNFVIKLTSNPDQDISANVSVVESGLKIVWKHDTDTTLSVAGLPADAAALREVLNEYGIVSFLDVINKTGGTSAGVTYDWTGNSCHVHGTATSESFKNFYESLYVLPAGMEAGKIYPVKFSGTNVRFRVYDNTGGIKGEQLLDTTTDAVLTLPSTCTGLIMRLFVADGTTADEIVTPKILTDMSTVRTDLATVQTNLATLDGELDALESDVRYFKNLDEGTDLNTASTTGYYLLSPNRNYANSPVEVGHRRLLFIIHNPANNYIYQSMIPFSPQDKKQYYIRYYVEGAWVDWENIFEEDDDGDNIVLANTNDVCTGTMPNKGERIIVMSYNVAHYNKDTSAYISDEKRMRLKQLIGAVCPDYIGTQEEPTNGYIDEQQTKTASDYIFKPVLPFMYGGLFPAIRSKVNYDSANNVQYSNGRSITYGVYTRGTAKILFISTHPIAGTSDANIAARLTQYTEIFKWIHKEIDLSETTCPDWDYCIISGDFNTATDTDKTNLKTLAEARNFTMANGGRFGWLATAQTTNGAKNSLDNIIVSPNIIINGVTSYSSLYDDLWSDHYPLVADLTLVEGE